MNSQLANETLSEWQERLDYEENQDASYRERRRLDAEIERLRERIRRVEAALDSVRAALLCPSCSPVIELLLEGDSK